MSDDIGDTHASGAVQAKDMQWPGLDARTFRRGFSLGLPAFGLLVIVVNYCCFFEAEGAGQQWGGFRLGLHSTYDVETKSQRDGERSWIPGIHASSHGVRRHDNIGNLG